MVKYKLEDQVGHLMRRANQRHAAIFFEGLNDQQLTPMQFAVLVKIGDEEEVSQNRLGRLAAMDPATVQGVVRRLKERALIDARPDPDDGRRSLWRLSETGEALVAATVPIAEQITEKTLEPLSKSERSNFLALLRKLA
ncbi:MAG: MarR family winged helix-turn-helix transcriptional regulator [Pseudomonadota bacterium]|nr:MarR family winged helix-turn-helix transcriptional regulator [Pseudomonadota bacterium]MEC8698896.1 MarR family winged helix-turn-helix transcriptional regulator [Pseudomonadota bacterium]MED6311976.1 MarR family winged helix-turn-helix transcriptional regulator [Pseudomonadota bacterium]